MIEQLPDSWPFPDAATDQRAVAEMPREWRTTEVGKSVARPKRRPPFLDDVQDAPY